MTRKKFFPLNSSLVSKVANRTASTTVNSVTITMIRIMFCMDSIKRESVNKILKLFNPTNGASPTIPVFPYRE